MYSTSSKDTYKIDELESFGKRKFWSAARRFSPYEVPHYPATYSNLENQDVLKTFQDSYERLQTDATIGTLPTTKRGVCNEESIDNHHDDITGDNASDSGNNNSLSYIGMIATAILRSNETKLTLAGIYTYMEKHFYGILSNRPGWRNTVRHNLSLHECFVKGEIAAEGKGRFWRIHPNYFEQFKCGKFNKNILQNSMPLFYRSLGNYRPATMRHEDMPLTPFNMGYSGSTWSPAFYPFISPSFSYPTLPFPRGTPSQPTAEYQDLHRLPFRSCSSDCCTANCPASVRHLPSIQCSPYRVSPQTWPIENTTKSPSV